MASSTHTAVLGAGSWGTAVANVLADAGQPVWVWGRDPAVADALNTQHENPKYLAAHPLNHGVRGSTDLAATLAASHRVVCAIPTQQIRSVFTPIAHVLNGKPVVNVSKGIEVGTHKRVSEIFHELCPRSAYFILSGPSFAEEVVRRLPSAVTIAGTEKDAVREIQSSFRTPYFRAYGSQDVVGVELAGALKNVVAIASGVVSGLGLGYNSQAALINRGIVEIRRIGQAQGAESLTFLGLAGMGDLILTCTGPLSRNRKVGELLAKGNSLAAIQKDLGGVAEGVFTAKSAYDLRGTLELPILEQVYKILYEGHSPKQAVRALMDRDLRDEWE